ncbi:MAG: hypothetical protein OER56_05570 [Hyphomicrobiales bacterium]|nr:hypothetical protein [Hyphomicrobiales bacterium]
MSVSILCGAPVYAASDADEGWPCVQRKIPELSAGMMWAGPPVNEAAKSLWQSNGGVSALAARLAVRRTSLDEADKLIADYAASVAAEDKAAHLTALFAGVLDLINAERRQIMAGIEKYTRKQRSLAKAIGKTRAELKAALEAAEPSEEEKKLRRDLEQKLSWQSRIHHDREKSLTFVCESPVILEQRIFAIARSIANNLE